MIRSLARMAALGCALTAATYADEPKARPPSPEAKGEVYEAKSADGLAYQYFVPKDYDKQKGTNLVFILHGSNLDRRWGFANHPAGEFCAQDIVVSPDGTRANGSGTFNFMQADKDTSRLHALHLELRKVFNIKETYLYGHSQGSFFAQFYAGQYPDFVSGVVGQASGMWIGTTLSKKHHHIAIALMHGTADPVVPYGQSLGAIIAYQKADYPNCRLRSLIGWNHWPDWNQAQQQLWYCVGIASKDTVRAEAAFDALLRVQDGADVVARYLVARRIVEETFCTPEHKEKARDVIARVDKAAAAHVAALDKALKDKNAWKLETAPAWIGHSQRFLREYQSVPACEAFRKTQEDRVRQHLEEAQRAWQEYEKFREKDPQRAFAEGIDLVTKAFLADGYVNADFLAALKAMKDDAKKLKIPATTLKLYDKAIPPYEQALKKGDDEYEKVQKAVGA
jgi:predicted esterase